MPPPIVFLINILVAILGAFISKVFFREVKPEIPDELRTLKRILLKLGFFDFIAWGLIGYWMFAFLNNYFTWGFSLIILNIPVLILLFISGFLASTVFGRFWQFYSSPALLVNRLEIVYVKCNPSEPEIKRESEETEEAELKIRLRQKGNFAIAGGTYGIKLKQDGETFAIVSGNETIKGLNEEVELTTPWLIKPRKKSIWQTTITAMVVANPNNNPVDSRVPPKTITVTVRETENPLDFIEIRDIQFIQDGAPKTEIFEATSSRVRIIVGVEREFFNLSENTKKEVSIHLYKNGAGIEYFSMPMSSEKTILNFDYEWTPEKPGTYFFAAKACAFNNKESDQLVRQIRVRYLAAAIKLESIRMEPEPNEKDPFISGELIYFYAKITNLIQKWISGDNFEIRIRLAGPREVILVYSGDDSLGPEQTRELGPIVWTGEAGEWVAKAEIEAAANAQISLPSDEKRTCYLVIHDCKAPEPKISSKSVVIKSEETELDASETIYTEGPWQWKHIWNIEGKEYTGKIITHKFKKEGIISVRLSVEGALGRHIIKATTIKNILVFLPKIEIQLTPEITASTKQSVRFKVVVDEDYMEKIKEKLGKIDKDFDLSELSLINQRISGCYWTLGPNNWKKTGIDITVDMPDETGWFMAKAEVSFSNASDKFECQSGLNLTKPVAVISYEVQEGTTRVKFSAEESSDPSGAQLHKFTWYFGDGQRSNEENPEYTYNTQSGKTEYTVKLTVENIYGAKDDDEELVRVELPIDFSIDRVGIITGMVGDSLQKKVGWKQDYRIFVHLTNISPTQITNIGCSLIEKDEAGVKREILLEPSDDTVKNGEKTYLISETLRKDWRWFTQFLMDLVYVDKKTKEYTYYIKIWGENNNQRKEKEEVAKVTVEVSQERTDAAAEAKGLLNAAFVAEVARIGLTYAAIVIGSGLPYPASTAAGPLYIGAEGEYEIVETCLLGAEAYISKAKD